MPISAGLEKLHDLAAGALEKGDCHAQRAQIQILGLDRDLVSGRAHVLGGGSGVAYVQQHDLAFGRTEFGKAECVKDFETTWCLNLVIGWRRTSFLQAQLSLLPLPTPDG